MALFDKQFKFLTYSVIVNNSSITFKFKDIHYPVPSNFTNKYDAITGELIIENKYLRFNALQPEYESMFDFIARGFKLGHLLPEKK